MIQIKKSGEVITGTTAELERLRLQFNAQCCVRLPGFLDTQLLELIQTQVEQAMFDERIHEGIGSNKELCMRCNFAATLLHFLLNNQCVFQVVQSLTGCDTIGTFEGRVYRFIPARGHQDAWHDDLTNYRLVALSINLSEHVYSGGTLQIRDRQSQQLVHQAANVGPGDALIFRLAHHLEHRITEVTGIAPKTAFAGWFKSQPEFLSLLKHLAQMESVAG